MSSTDLTPDQEAELEALASMSDAEIDTSDIPVIIPFSNPQRGLFADAPNIKLETNPAPNPDRQSLHAAAHAVSEEPYATCRVVEIPTDQLPYGSYHIVSMMRALQAGRSLSVQRSRITWQDADGAILGWKCDEETWDPTGDVPDRLKLPGIAAGPDYQAALNAVEKIVIGTEKRWVIRWGREPSAPDNGTCAFIVHSRPSHGNVPRMELSPDGVIRLWYHRPEPDLNGDDFIETDSSTPLPATERKES